MKTNDEDISIEKLTKHINANHPLQIIKKEDDEEIMHLHKSKFSMFERVGSLITGETNDDLLTQIGLGPNLMLMIIKSLLNFSFIIMAISCFLISIYAYNQWDNINKLFKLQGVSVSFIYSFL